MEKPVSPQEPSAHKEEFLVVDVPPSEEGRALLRFLENALKTHDLPFFANARNTTAQPHSITASASAAEAPVADAVVARLAAHDSTSQSSAAAAGSSDSGKTLLMLVRQEGWPPPPPPGS